MNHPDPTPATITTAQSVCRAADAARVRLTTAFALPFGPVREQRITESVLELIAAEVGARNPAIATVLLDWEPYGGLSVSGLRDRHGNPIDDHDLTLDITFYASDIRATADTALTGSRPHEPGLFRLDLTAAMTSATQPPGIVAAHTLRAGQRLDHGKRVHAVTGREDHLDIAFDDGTWWCDVPAQHPITLWDGNPSTRRYPFTFLATDEYRIHRRETGHDPTHRPGAPEYENPPTRTPRVGDRVRITGLLPGDPAPLDLGATGTVTGFGARYAGQIFVDWDNGRALILLDSDPFEILSAESAATP
ncbi:MULTISPECIES: hypothetical protein [Nocardia]|uniref:DUF4314 domain-containing protein n=1 Tax=Nocardia speluncae TaxID=419477 RepID=A0A846XFZ3_9NOCA|nr:MULTISPECIES: hypothetical protein [Nocardia]MBF6456057.1 hypothetical protein [Nocardia cyriacigeorgica]MBF6477122.1 hypothetical protein [Nocardia cyriacigeorgica]MBF6553203.1 hypothetical protein [Nocardia cyriacigeorgica]NKY34882.1 hypothetical protein [Nocardia speluncae]